MFARKNLKPTNMSNINIKSICAILFLIISNSIIATPLPKTSPVYVELRCKNYAWRDRHGASYYIWTSDIYTKEKRMEYPKSSSNGVVKFEFETYFPVYSVINTNHNTTIPFYVEPYDSLVIEIDPSGKPLMYRNTDGSKYRYANMLAHDISNNKLYTTDDYYNDREASTFLSFTENLTNKMRHATDSVSMIADLYGFSDKERNLALCNTRMQFMLWMFEYTTYRSHMLQEYAEKHDTGWQNSYDQDKEIEHINTPEYYTELLSSTINDKDCLASQYLDVFINGYERSELLRHDLYMYSGNTHADSLRMDSVRFARDMAISGISTPSPIINLIVERQYVDIPDDYGHILKEAKIVSNRKALPINYRPLITQREIDDAKSFHAPQGFNIMPLISWGIEKLANLCGISLKKGQKRLSKRKAILKSFEEDDDIKQKIEKGLR